MNTETERKIWDAYHKADNEKSEYVSGRNWGGYVLPPGVTVELIREIIEIVKSEAPK
jgi:hypothetical protein